MILFFYILCYNYIGDYMYSIKDQIIFVTEIQKSRFICKIIRIDNLNQINDELNIIKKEYKDANHYCYAYIIDNIKRFSDDGEPSGTAGIPILNVIEAKKLTNILVIVVRYFGGIKLGAGGLVRAYINSVVNTLNETNIIELIKSKKIKIIFDYDKEKYIRQLVPDINIIEKKYLDKVEFIVLIKNTDLSLLNEYNLEILEENIFLEK